MHLIGALSVNSCLLSLSSLSVTWHQQKKTPKVNVTVTDITNNVTTVKSNQFAGLHHCQLAGSVRSAATARQTAFWRSTIATTRR